MDKKGNTTTSSKIPMTYLTNPLDPRSEDLDSFKDVEISLADNLELESLGDEGWDDFSFEQSLPRNSGRHALKDVREEHA